METNQNFEPRQIGDENARYSQQAQSDYEALLDVTNRLRSNLHLSIKGKISLDGFLNFVQSDPEKWISEKFVVDNKINMSGLSIDKIIELKMLDIPHLPEVMNTLEKFKTAIEKVKRNNFFFPLREFYEMETDSFAENVKFWSARDEHFANFTQNEAQNRILSKFEKLCEALNDLCEDDILRPAKHGIMELATLTEYLEISKVRAAPFVVKRYLFKAHRLRNYDAKPVIKNNNISDLFH